MRWLGFKMDTKTKELLNNVIRSGPSIMITDGDLYLLELSQELIDLLNHLDSLPWIDQASMRHTFCKTPLFLEPCVDKIRGCLQQIALFHIRCIRPVLATMKGALS